MTPTYFHDQALAWISAIYPVLLTLISSAGVVWVALKQAAHGKQIDDISTRQDRQGAKINTQQAALSVVQTNALPPAAVSALISAVSAPASAPPVAPADPAPPLPVTVAPPLPDPPAPPAPPAPRPVNVTITADAPLSADELAAAHAALNAQAASPALPVAPVPAPGAVIIAQPPTDQNQFGQRPPAPGESI